MNQDQSQDQSQDQTEDQFDNRDASLDTSLIDTPSSDEESLIDAPPPQSQGEKIIKRMGWIGFALICFIFFTLIKLPDDRLKNYIDGTLNSVLAQRGIAISSTDSHMSYLFGISYVMKGVTLMGPPPSPPIHIQKVEISPSLLSLLVGKFGGSLFIQDGEGSLNSSFSMKGSKISASGKLKKFDIGKAGLLTLAADIQASAVLDGNFSISGDFSVPSSLDGSTAIHLSQVIIDPQTIAGFSIPRLSISEGIIDLTFDQGKATIKTFQLGKTGNPADDLKGTLTGDATLAKQWESSTLNLKSRFSLSENVLKAFVILDVILGGGKQPDGSYAFSLIGPIEAPIPMPISAGMPDTNAPVPTPSGTP